MQLVLLKPTTQLYTYDVTDLSNILPQEEWIFILTIFLHQFGYEHVQKMTIQVIEQLARIVLTGNICIDHQKYYRQVVAEESARNLLFPGLLFIY